MSALLHLRPDLPSRARPGSRAGTAARSRRGGGAMNVTTAPSAAVREPTPEQRKAIETRDRDVLLEAGAGTGKTGVLVDRYCDAIELDGVSPVEILAFTFTDRAAAQLRGRIRDELDRRGVLVQSEFGGALITTIHGFCHRLLASHPVAAGIDPRFRVLETAEADRVARQAFDRALEEFL